MSNPVLPILAAFAGFAGTMYALKGTSSRGSRPSLNPSRARWEDYVEGEWWIDEMGDAEYCDIDVGDIGHEGAAINALVDKDKLLDAMVEQELVDEDDADSMRDDGEYGTINIMAENEQAMKQLDGSKVVGSQRLWDDIMDDARTAYIQHRKAIQVVGTSFTVWKLDKDTIKRIGDFIFEQVGERVDADEGPDPDSEITIEEIGSDNRTGTVTMKTFFSLTTPREFWAAVKGSAAQWQAVASDD